MIFAPPDLLRRVAALGRDECSAAACVIVGSRGSTPQSAGALMFIDEVGGIHGTIGGGCIEADVRRRAMPMIGKKESAVLQFRLDGDYGWDDGLICGGSLEVAVAPAPGPEALERIAEDIENGRATRLELEVFNEETHERITLHIAPRPRLYIAGAGHVGQAVARLALSLDFEVTVFDDRPDLLSRLPKPVQTVCGPIAQRLGEAAIDERTYCLIVTRGHRHDAQALGAVLGRESGGADPCYVGMIGSRRKVIVTFEELESRGIGRERLETVHAPVGLSIGAQTVEEIAVSIAAQLVQVRGQSQADAGVRRGDLIERTDLSLSSGQARTAPIGIVLAAGRSTRMGRTKQTLALPGDPDGRCLVAGAYDAIAPVCGAMVVVVAHDAPAVCEALGGRAFVSAQAPQGAEMFESVMAGLTAARGLDPSAPVLLHLADHPRVGESTLRSLVQACADHPECAIIPTFDEQGGHPVLIPASLVELILESATDIRDGGLRGFWIANPDRCVRLPVDDPTIVLDVDYPHDYRDLLQGVV